MYDRIRAWVLRVLRVPPEPEPPFGDPASIRVFRASRRFYYLRLMRWGVTQVAALVGILFWFSVIIAAEHEAKRTRAEAATSGRTMPALKAGQNRPPTQAFEDIAGRVPPGVFALLWLGKGLGVLVYLGQLGFTYMAVRLDYELRWYMVTDRSLRIRSGLWSVQERTMSFANIQQVMVWQGPLQRLLGIADVRVESAGGGGRSQDLEHGKSESMHSGVFHGVDNANEIRDLILERLRQFRETGLGDPDEERDVELVTNAAGADGNVMAAAQELLEETRRLRRAFSDSRS